MSIVLNISEPDHFILDMEPIRRYPPHGPMYTIIGSEFSYDQKQTIIASYAHLADFEVTTFFHNLEETLAMVSTDMEDQMSFGIIVNERLRTSIAYFESVYLNLRQVFVVMDNRPHMRDCESYNRIQRYYNGLQRVPFGQPYFKAVNYLESSSSPLPYVDDMV